MLLPSKKDAPPPPSFVRLPPGGGHFDTFFSHPGFYGCPIPFFKRGNRVERPPPSLTIYPILDFSCVICDLLNEY